MVEYREGTLSFIYMIAHKWLWIRIEQTCSLLINELCFEYTHNAQIYGMASYG